MVLELNLEDKTIAKVAVLLARQAYHIAEQWQRGEWIFVLHSSFIHCYLIVAIRRNVSTEIMCYMCVFLPDVF